MNPNPTTAARADTDPARRAAIAEVRARHWRKTRRLTVVLLLVWLATGFCTVFFARELAAVTVFGWPLSFYLAAQGASLIYLAILMAYAGRMRRIDAQLKRDEREIP